MKTSKTLARLLALTLCLTTLLVCVPAMADGETYATVWGGRLNLRQSASLEAKVLAQYPTGTWVTILEKGDVWCKVSVGGKTGYMMTKYLSTDNGSSTMYVRTNTGIGLNLRKGPSQKSEIITSFKPDTAVTVLKKGSGWYLVSVNGQQGYMSSQYLVARKASYTTPVTPFTAKLKNINGGSIVNFRLYPGMNTKIIRTYPVGTEVKVLEKGVNWSKVEIDGVQGYVSTYFLAY